MARLKGSPNWTIDQKAQAVAVLQTEANGCLREAERLTDISRITIAQAVVDPEISKIAEVKKAELGKRFNSLLGKLLERYEDQVWAANLENKGTTLLGIVADKALLYNDEPNQITQHTGNPAAKEQATVILAQIQIELGLSGAEAEAKLIEIAPETAKQAGYLK